MLMRLVCIAQMFLLLACVSPREQARQEATAATGHDASIQFAAENRCQILGFQQRTDAFAQCVTATIDQQSSAATC